MLSIFSVAYFTGCASAIPVSTVQEEDDSATTAYLDEDSATISVVDSEDTENGSADGVDSEDTELDRETDTDGDTDTDFGNETDSENPSDSEPVVQTSVLIGTAPGSSSNDTWNNAENWDTRFIPSGTDTAIINTGVKATVDNDATASYSGGLLLETNASLTVGWATNYAANANALGTGPIVMRDGSEIISRGGLCEYDFAQGITLEGDAAIWAGISTACHWTKKTFSGGIVGDGVLTYKGVNGTWFLFDKANPQWTGGFETEDPQNQRHGVEAKANGCFGTGNVSIKNNCTLIIGAGLTDTIDDTATLSLSGAQADNQDSKLVLNSSETVGALFIDGVPMPAGDYTNTENWLSGSGTLSVLTNP